jgi:hypothetical protein
LVGGRGGEGSEIDTPIADRQQLAKPASTLDRPPGDDTGGGTFGSEEGDDTTGDALPHLLEMDLPSRIDETF